MGTDRGKDLLGYINKALAVFSGILFVATGVDLVHFLLSPQDYAPLIGPGSNLGAPYSSDDMYLQAAASGTALAGVAFISGFAVCGDKRKIFTRILLLLIAFAWRGGY